MPEEAKYGAECQDELSRLAEAEARYRSMFENAVEGIFQTTPEGAYLAANSALARIYGYPCPEELIQGLTDISHQLYVRPESRDEFKRLLQEQDQVSGFEAEVYRRDGQVIWISEHARAVRDSLGKLLYYEGTVQDITRRKCLESQLAQSQKMEAIGRLAGGVAHDFNNMLGVIMGYTDLLLEQAEAPSMTRTCLLEVQKATQRATSLTNQLLAFARKQVVAPRVLDLQAVVSGMETMLRPLIGEEIDLAITLPEATGRVKADPNQLEQVLLNLVVNARDAMPAGGQCTVEIRNAELDESYTRQWSGLQPGRYVLLAVSDTGCGMDSATLSRIFEPFFTTKATGKGTGLGLATVYAIVQQSGGHLCVYSEPGAGSTFKVYLPRVDGEPEHLAGIAHLAEAAPGTETVLLVEDEEMVRSLVREVLQKRGYTVLEAEHGRRALEVFAGNRERIDLLLTDVVMPGLGGREVAERITAASPRTRVLYMSGYTDDAVVRHGVLGAETPYIQKPFTPVALARKVRGVLDHSSARLT